MHFSTQSCFQHRTSFLTPRDRSAFGQIVKRYQRLVTAVCREYLNDGYDAQDACQDETEVEVTLNCALERVTIRYTTDGSEPTEEYGILAGRGTKVVISESTVLKAVSYITGEPKSVSEVAVDTL